MGTLTTNQFVVCFASLCVLLYVVYMLGCRHRPKGYPEYFEAQEPFNPEPVSPAAQAPAAQAPAQAPAVQTPATASVFEIPAPTPEIPYKIFPEPPPPPASIPTPEPTADLPVNDVLENEEEATGPQIFGYDLQAAIDFSDLTVTDQQRTDIQELQENAKQILTADERFNAAKRKNEEHKLKKGIFPAKKKRQLLEALIRRPFCGRRVRSWRTQFSDSLRGDVIPKNKDNSWSMMRIGRSDPMVDLHQGALGPLSSTGRWVSDENVPENTFDDMFEENF